MSVKQPPVEAVLSDIEIVELIKAGETSLFELIMRRYNQRLFRVIRSILKDDDEAQEVVQETYVRAFEHLRQFEARAQFSTWLTKIAIYEAYAHIRNRRKASQPDEDWEGVMPSGQRSPEEQTFDAEMRVLLEGVIDALPPDYRTVFMMREVEGMSTAETAECLNISEENVKVRLSRARATIRRQLFERAGTTSSDAFSFLGARCDRIVQAVMARILT
jgi:RNA polymerase sigma-70 factor (ECF subfamily)